MFPLTPWIYRLVKDLKFSTWVFFFYKIHFAKLQIFRYKSCILHACKFYKIEVLFAKELSLDTSNFQFLFPYRPGRMPQEKNVYCGLGRYLQRSLGEKNISRRWSEKLVCFLFFSCSCPVYWSFFLIIFSLSS